MIERNSTLVRALTLSCCTLLLAANFASAGTQSTNQAKSGSSNTYNGQPVLDPAQFYGMAAMGYASAQSAPSVMSKIFCYCGCDVTDNHKNLIDCFTSTHGVDCHICQEEANDALKLHRDGLPIAEIQKQIDAKFAHFYPFSEETANLKHYKATVLYKTSATASGATAGMAKDNNREKPGAWTPSFWSSGESTPAEAAKRSSKSQKSNTAPTLKPGFSVGDCCAEKSKP